MLDNYHRRAITFIADSSDSKMEGDLWETYKGEMRPHIWVAVMVINVNSHLRRLESPLLTCFALATNGSGRSE